MDANDSGTVELAELKVCLEELCRLFDLDAPDTNDVAMSLLDLDDDKNGNIEEGEFIKLVKETLECMKDSHGTALDGIAEAPAPASIAEAPAPGAASSSEAPAPTAT